VGEESAARGDPSAGASALGGATHEGWWAAAAHGGLGAIVAKDVTWPSGRVVGTTVVMDTGASADACPRLPVTVVDAGRSERLPLPLGPGVVEEEASALVRDEAACGDEDDDAPDGFEVCDPEMGRGDVLAAPIVFERVSKQRLSVSIWDVRQEKLALTPLVFRGAGVAEAEVCAFGLVCCDVEVAGGAGLREGREDEVCWVGFDDCALVPIAVVCMAWLQ
jgi:hypothetical protein